MAKIIVAGTYLWSEEDLGCSYTLKNKATKVVTGVVPFQKGTRGVMIRVYRTVHGQLQMEVIIAIPLEWGLWSEQGTCVSLCSHLECTWRRERNFLISSWDVPVTTQHIWVRQQIHCLNVKCLFIVVSITLNKHTFYILKSFLNMLYNIYKN